LSAKYFVQCIIRSHREVVVLNAELRCKLHIIVAYCRIVGVCMHCDKTSCDVVDYYVYWAVADTAL